MAKQPSIRYTARIRQAEEELDAFLHSINNAPRIDIMEELRNS